MLFEGVMRPKRTATELLIRACGAGLVFLATACAARPQSPSPMRIAALLPAPVTNNAVALVEDGASAALYSFNGLGAGKTWKDVTNAAYVCVLPAGECREIPRPPVSNGRLASVAVALGGRIYLFGGYTVAEDGAEKSTPEVFAFDPGTERYERRADMPVPVDDSLAFSYAGRYIYLVSGWHDEGNVGLVQVYDALNDRWFRATDYPGAPVFGHAGGAVGRRFLVVDGVAVIGEENGRRKFAAVDEAWLGEIDVDDPARISWRKLPSHPGGPLYRMAAAGDGRENRVVFYGGADNPYNYDGIGYDGAPASPSAAIFAWDFDLADWVRLGETDRPSMDHRGLLIARETSYIYIVGGMDRELAVMDAVTAIEIE